MERAGGVGRETEREGFSFGNVLTSEKNNICKLLNPFMIVTWNGPFAKQDKKDNEWLK